MRISPRVQWAIPTDDERVLLLRELGQFIESLQIMGAALIGQFVASVLAAAHIHGATIRSAKFAPVARPLPRAVIERLERFGERLRIHRAATQKK